MAEAKNEQSFVIEIEKQTEQNGYKLTFAGCLSEKNQKGKQKHALIL